jgi:hypothetical protein
MFLFKKNNRIITLRALGVIVFLFFFIVNVKVIIKGQDYDFDSIKISFNNDLYALPAVDCAYAYTIVNSTSWLDYLVGNYCYSCKQYTGCTNGYSGISYFGEQCTSGSGGGAYAIVSGFCN